MSDQIETAAAAMSRDYIILAFLVSLGALQIAVSISGIRGLWLLPNQGLTRILGILLIFAGIAFYILSPLWIAGPWAAGSVIDGTSEHRVWGTATLDEITGARNLNDIHGGMAGTAYAVFFVLSAILATLFAAAVGTINTRRLAKPSNPHPNTDGLDALKHHNPYETLTASIRHLGISGKSDITQHMRSAHSWSIPVIIERMWRN